MIISFCAAPSPKWSRSWSTAAQTTPNGQFTAAQFRDRVDNGRKVAIQILEFFDRHGVTLRRGDLRRINKHRLDLFRRAAATANSETFQEENRPRWGVRTSNPGGAASRSLVGSTPSLFRHVQELHDDACFILPRCVEARGGKGRAGRRRFSPRDGRAIAKRLIANVRLHTAVSTSCMRLPRRSPPPRVRKSQLPRLVR